MFFVQNWYVNALDKIMYSESQYFEVWQAPPCTTFFNDPPFNLPSNTGSIGGKVNKS